MEKQYITFDVTNQIIKRTDSEAIVARSRNYLYAKFNFLTDEWTDETKTAIFKMSGSDNTAYMQVLEDDECLVPWEVLGTNGGFMHVSVFAGELVTANVARVRILITGYTEDVEESVTPTASAYEQLVARVEATEEAIKETISTAEETISGYATTAQEAAESASTSASDAETAKSDAEQAVEDAQAAQKAAEKAVSDAETAQTAAEAAAELAQEYGYRLSLADGVLSISSN